MFKRSYKESDFTVNWKISEAPTVWSINERLQRNNSTFSIWFLELNKVKEEIRMLDVNKVSQTNDIPVKVLRKNKHFATTSKR